MSSVLQLTDVSVVRAKNPIVDHVTWSVDGSERWVVLGPNGAGKTTLLQIAAALIHPSSGKAKLLDDRLGAVDVFELRPRIGFVSSAMSRRIPGHETVLNVVMTAAYSVTGRWNEEYEEVDLDRARSVLDEWKLGAFVDRRFGGLSDGAQKPGVSARAAQD